MGRFHKKRSGFYNTIMDSTEILTNGDNVIVRSLTINDENAQYCINSELFLKCADLFFRIASKEGAISHKDASKETYDNIFSVYKTKVATVKVPYLVLNTLVKGGIFYSDDGEDYIKKNDEISFVNFLKRIGVLECI